GQIHAKPGYAFSCLRVDRRKECVLDALDDERVRLAIFKGIANSREQDGCRREPLLPVDDLKHAKLLWNRNDATEKVFGRVLRNRASDVLKQSADFTLSP